MKYTITMHHFCFLFLFLLLSVSGSSLSDAWADRGPFVSNERSISMDWNWQPLVRLKYKKLNNNGVLRMTDEDKSKSIELLEKSLSLKPKNDQIRYNLGLAYFSTRDYQMTIETLSELTNSRVGDVNFAIGMAHLELGELEAALSAFIRSGTAEALYNVGLYYYRSSQYPKALFYAQRAMQKSKEDRACMLLYGYCMVQQKSKRISIDRFTDWIEDRKFDGPSYAICFQLLLQLEDTARAVAMADHVKSLKVDSSVAAHFYTQLARVYSFAKEYGKAQAYFHRAIEVDSLNTCAWSGLGQMCIAQRDLAMADSAFDRLIELKEEVRGKTGKAIVAHLDENYGKARSIYQFLIADTTIAADACYRFAYNEHLLGDDHGAVRWAVKACAADPDQPGYHALAGMLYGRTFQYEKGIESIKRAIACAPKKLPYVLQLANAHTYIHNYGKAGRAYRTALELDPNNPKALSGYAMNLVKGRKYKKAMEYADRAVELEPDHPFFHMNRADVYVSLAQMDEFADLSDSLFGLAINSIHYAQRVDSTDMCWHYDNNLGLIHHYMEDYLVADSLFLMVTNRVTLNNRGVNQKRLGNVSAAAELFDSAMVRDAKYLEPQLNQQLLNGERTFLRKNDEEWYTYWYFLDDDLSIKEEVKLNAILPKSKDLDPKVKEIDPKLFNYFRIPVFVFEKRKTGKTKSKSSVECATFTKRK